MAQTLSDDSGDGGIDPDRGEKEKRNRRPTTKFDPTATVSTASKAQKRVTAYFNKSASTLRSTGADSASTNVSIDEDGADEEHSGEEGDSESDGEDPEVVVGVRSPLTFRKLTTTTVQATKKNTKRRNLKQSLKAKGAKRMGDEQASAGEVCCLQ
jgi:hypothetical protein